MKTCNKCKWAGRAPWFSILWFGDREDTYMCWHPEALNKVSGEGQACFTIRNYGPCGKDGGLFEARNARDK